MNVQALLIFLIAGVFAFISFYINKKWGGLEFQKTHGDRLKTIQSEMMTLAKTKDEGSLKKMSELQSEFSSLMMKSMWSNLKTLLFVLPILWGFLALLSSFFPDFLIHLPINLKGFSIFTEGFIIDTSYGYRGFFLVSTLAFSLTLQSIYTRTLKKKEPVKQDEPKKQD